MENQAEPKTEAVKAVEHSEMVVDQIENKAEFIPNTEPTSERELEQMLMDAVSSPLEQADLPEVKQDTPEPESFQDIKQELPTPSTIVILKPIKDEPAKTPAASMMSNALSMLAQYSGSDSEDDEVDDSIYRKPRSPSSSSCSSDSDDNVDIKVIEKKIREPVESDNDSNDEHPGRMKKKDPLKVKGELTIDDLPPIQDLQITVDERECIEIGVITTIVDQLVLVEALRNSVPLDIDSVLFLDNGKQALGRVFDVIGPVAVPIYCVRFNNHDDIALKGIAVGTKVFCAPRTEYSSFVILSSIMTKGSDASWKNDIEPPENLVDHSDDEYERSIKRKAKASRNQNQPNERREFVRGRRYMPNQQSNNQNQYPGNQNQYPSNQYQQPSNQNQQPNLAYPNYSWHQNLPQIGPQGFPQNYYQPQQQ